MRETTKAKLKHFGKKIALMYFGLLLGAGLLFADHWGWMKPMKSLKEFQPQMEAFEAKQLSDGTHLDHCLYLRDVDKWTPAARQCLLNTIERLETEFGKAMAAGYLAQAEAPIEIRQHLLEDAITAMKREREHPWNQLQEEAVQACKETITPCLMSDLISGRAFYDRNLNTLQKELERINGRLVGPLS